MDQQKFLKVVQLAIKTGKLYVSLDIYEEIKKLVTVDSNNRLSNGILIIQDKHLPERTILAAEDAESIINNLDLTTTPLTCDANSTTTFVRDQVSRILTDELRSEE